MSFHDFYILVKVQQCKYTIQNQDGNLNVCKDGEITKDLSVPSDLGR